MHLKILSAIWQPFRWGGDEFKCYTCFFNIIKMLDTFLLIKNHFSKWPWKPVKLCGPTSGNSLWLSGAIHGIIDLGQHYLCNGLFPAQCQAITCTITELLSTKTKGTKIIGTVCNEDTQIYWENEFEIFSAKWWPFYEGPDGLNHSGRDEIDPILQMTFSYKFSWKKIVIFWFKLHGNMFPRVQLTVCHHRFG